MKAPRLVKPLYNEYITVGYVLKNERFVYDFTEDEFIKACMIHANGSLNPSRLKEVYKMLMEEAGL